MLIHSVILGIAKVTESETIGNHGNLYDAGMSSRLPRDYALFILILPRILTSGIVFERKKHCQAILLLYVTGIVFERKNIVRLYYYST